MTRATFNVLFYIKRTKKLRDGTSPIYARISVNGKRAEFALQRSIEINEWDNRRGYASGHSKRSRQLNSYIDFVKGKLHQHRIYLEERGKQLTAPLLKNAYLGIDKDEKSILSVFRDHNERCKSLINIDRGQ